MPDIATTEPAEITSGSTHMWTKNLSDYKPEDGWVLSYSLFNAARQETITATDNGDSTHLATITAAGSALYVAGEYEYQAYVTKAAERYDVGCGDVVVKPNAATGAVDGRSHVKKTLDAINTTLEVRATKGSSDYSIDGFSITRNSFDELVAAKTKYENWYAQEVRAARLAKGLGHSGSVRVRL